MKPIQTDQIFPSKFDGLTEKKESAESSSRKVWHLWPVLCRRDDALSHCVHILICVQLCEHECKICIHGFDFARLDSGY